MILLGIVNYSVWLLIKKLRIRTKGGAMVDFSPRETGNSVNMQVMPSVDFSPRECVESQLAAIQANDEPW